MGIRGFFPSIGPSGENDRNVYDDAIILIAPSFNIFAAFNGNTDPSRIHQGFGTSEQTKGMAVLKTGVWPVIILTKITVISRMKLFANAQVQLPSFGTVTRLILILVILVLISTEEVIQKHQALDAKQSRLNNGMSSIPWPVKLPKSFGDPLGKIGLLLTLLENKAGS